MVNCLDNVLRESYQISIPVFVKEVQQVSLTPFSELKANDILSLTTHMFKAGPVLSFLFS
jgi:hypothetical protein